MRPKTLRCCASNDQLLPGGNPWYKIGGKGRGRCLHLNFCRTAAACVDRCDDIWGEPGPGVCSTMSICTSTATLENQVSEVLHTIDDMHRESCMRLHLVSLLKPQLHPPYRLSRNALAPPKYQRRKAGVYCVEGMKLQPHVAF
jgi:hypothetical protein